MIGDKRPEPRTWNLKGEVKCLENRKCPPLRSEFYLVWKCHCWVKDDLETKEVFQLKQGRFLENQAQMRKLHTKAIPWHSLQPGWALGPIYPVKQHLHPSPETCNAVPWSEFVDFRDSAGLQPFLPQHTLSWRISQEKERKSHFHQQLH